MLTINTPLLYSVGLALSTKLILWGNSEFDAAALWYHNQSKATSLAEREKHCIAFYGMSKFCRSINYQAVLKVVSAVTPEHT